MKYLSICSGIEAATCAWDPLGFIPLAFSEIDDFPCAVLAHHYPNVANLGDLNRFPEWGDYEPDVIVGGTPCQSFSIVGWRTGLADERGNLSIVYLRLIDRYRPRWFIWENVPGVLSSNGGRDFQSFLRAVGQLGYWWSYRILDARYFGVPQSRRRVFVVGHIGDWRGPAAVLFQPGTLRIAAGENEKIRNHSTSFQHGTDEYLKGRFPCGSANVAGSLRKHRGSGDRKNGSPVEGYALYADRVRYLTPVEWERLQGFPDNYTRIPYRGKPADQCPDGHRYAALGNSMAVPVMRWLGERLQTVDNLMVGNS